MSDKQYRVTIQISCDATVLDRTARTNMDQIDDIIGAMVSDYAEGAITITVMEKADIVTVRAPSTTPRAKRGSAVADELAALKARVEAMQSGGNHSGIADNIALAPGITDAERAALNPANLTVESVAAVVDAATPGKRVKPVALAPADDAA